MWGILIFFCMCANNNFKYLLSYNLTVIIDLGNLLIGIFVILLTGKYLQMTSILKPIAFEVISCMSQLFDFYLYTVSIFSSQFFSVFIFFFYSSLEG